MIPLSRILAQVLAYELRPAYPLLTSFILTKTLGWHMSPTWLTD
jgi:hypothetical protein